jgi:hypothetical protein
MVRVFLAGESRPDDDAERWLARDALSLACFEVVEAAPARRYTSSVDLLSQTMADLTLLLTCEWVATLPGYVVGWDLDEADAHGIPAVTVAALTGDVFAELDDDDDAQGYADRPRRYVGRARRIDPQTRTRKVGVFVGKAAVVSTVAAVGVTAFGGFGGSPQPASASHAWDDAVFKQVKTGSAWLCDPSLTLTASCVTQEGLHLSAQAYVGPDSLAFVFSYVNPDTGLPEQNVLRVFANARALAFWFAPYRDDQSDRLPNLTQGSRWAIYGTDPARVKLWATELHGGGMVPADVTASAVAMGLLPEPARPSSGPMLASAITLPPSVQNAVQAILTGKAPTSADGGLILPTDPVPPILIPILVPPPTTDAPPVVSDPAPPATDPAPPATDPAPEVDPAPPTTDPAPVDTAPEVDPAPPTVAPAPEVDPATPDPGTDTDAPAPPEGDAPTPDPLTDPAVAPGDDDAGTPVYDACHSDFGHSHNPDNDHWQH